MVILISAEEIFLNCLIRNTPRAVADPDQASVGNIISLSSELPCIQKCSGCNQDAEGCYDNRQN